MNELQITNYKLQKELLELIKEEINVKQIVFGEKLELDKKITPELKEEGMMREIVRNIQDMRKKANLKPKDKISVIYSGAPELEAILQKNEKIILTEGKIKILLRQGQGGKRVFLMETSIKLDEKDLKLAIKKN